MDSTVRDLLAVGERLFANRLREPSTWAALAVLLGVFGLPVPEGLDEALAGTVDGIVAAATMIAAITGAVMKEKGHGD